MTGPDTHIDAEALAAALDEHNRWRRDDDGDEPAPNPTELGRTIDAAAGMLRTLRARVAALEAERAGLASRKDGAYLERNQVVAALAKCFPSGVALTAIDGWSEDWHGCVYIDLPTGQVSWHFHDSQAYLFDGLPAYGGTWDGHDTPEKYRRVAALRAERAAVVPEIDYFALIAAATARVKGAQGTPRCVAFKAGAEWFREQVLAAAPTPTPGDAP